MKVVPLDAGVRTQWDMLCEVSPEAWLFHCSSWIDIEARYQGAQNHSFAVESKGRLVALLPLFERRLELGGVCEHLIDCGVHRYTGFCCVLQDPRERREVERLAMRHVLSVAVHAGADRIQLNRQTLAPAFREGHHDIVPFWVVDDGFQLGVAFGPAGLEPAPGFSTCALDQIVSLDVAEEELFHRLAPASRRAVRKALACGLQFERPSGSGSEVERFYRLALRSARRTGEAVPSREYYAAVHASLAGSGQCAFLFASHEGGDVAGLIVLVWKGAMSYLAGASDPDALPMRVNDFIHWMAMTWGRRQGISAYRLGPWFPEVPRDWPIATMSRFKTRFGARSLPVVQGSLFLRPERYAEIAYRHATRYRDGQCPGAGRGRICKGAK